MLGLSICYARSSPLVAAVRAQAGLFVDQRVLPSCTAKDEKSKDVQGDRIPGELLVRRSLVRAQVGEPSGSLATSHRRRAGNTHRKIKPRCA
jgi:hypothetical protein